MDLMGHIMILAFIVNEMGSCWRVLIMGVILSAIICDISNIASDISGSLWLL